MRHSLLFGVRAELVPLASEVCPQPGNLLIGELDRGVVVGDGCLCNLDTNGTLLAAPLVALAPNADEIGIGAASTFRMANDQPSTALTAVDRTLEVVLMLAILLASEVLGREQALD